MTTDYRLQDDTLAAPQLLVSTLPLFILLIYFLVETCFRSHEVPYSKDTGANYDYQIPTIRLLDMLISFIIVAFMWACLLIYLVFYVPRRHSLIKRYLAEGFPVLGDVFFLGRSCCNGFHHYGKVIYHHTDHEKYPVHLTRTVRVFERFTREKVTILVLPDYAFSGHVKEDLEIDNLVITKSRAHQRYLRKFALAWLVFSYVAPLYILYVMGLSPPEVDNEKQGWIIYLVCTLLGIPILSFTIVATAWARHFYWVTKGDGRMFVDGEMRTSTSWFDNEDYEMVNYQPPKPSHSLSSEETSFTEETPEISKAKSKREERKKKRYLALSFSEASELTGEHTAASTVETSRRGLRRFF